MATSLRDLCRSLSVMQLVLLVLCSLSELVAYVSILFHPSRESAILEIGERC